MARCKRHALVSTLFALASTAAHMAHAQTISFFRQFGAPRISAAADTTADTSGIYVISNRGDCHAAAPECRSDVSKYDYAGNELWSREFSAPTVPRPQLIRATADSTGLYVLAWNYDRGPFLLRKYDSGGGELWSRQLTFSSWRGLAADSTGVYVAGEESFPGSTASSSYVRKYSLDGTESWTNQFDASRGAVAGVVADSTGVYVMNLHGAAGPPVRTAGVIVRKYDEGGKQLWARELSESDLPRTMAPAPAGFYILAADAWGSGTFLRKYDASGNEAWSRKLELFGDDTHKVAADATGVYIAGAIPMGHSPVRPWTNLPGQCRSGSGGEFFVRKYDVDGEPAWERQFGTSQGGGAAGLIVDSNGVYVVGAVSADGFRDQWELVPPEVLDIVDEPPSAFVARFDKTPATLTTSGPRIIPNCVVNAASYLGGGVAPGEIVTIFGSGMGPLELTRQHAGENGRLGTTLAETRILFNGAAAPLVYVSDKQITAIVPYAIAEARSADVQVEYKGVRSNVVTVPVLASRPGIFSSDGSGQGQAAILNEDGTLNSPSNPAQRGSVITIFGTGGGETAGGVTDGQILTSVLPQPGLPVHVFFDLGNNEYQVRARHAEVLYAGGVPGSVTGLLQIKVRVPADAVTTGAAVPFALFIGSQWTMFQVTVALR